jgi:hypothetical protein
VGIAHHRTRVTPGRRVIVEHVAISIGSITFQVLDQTAYRSSLGILTRTATLAEVVFGP